MENVSAHRSVYDFWLESAEGHADSTFLVFIDRDGFSEKYSYAEFHGHTSQVAALLKEIGVRKGDRVGIHLHDCPEYLMIMLASMWIGAIAVPINPGYTSFEIDCAVSSSTASVVITEDEPLLSKLPSCQSGDVRVVSCRVAGYSGEESESFFHEQKSLMSDSFSGLAADVSPEDVATILFTSGTTARPKGVMLSHASLVNSAYYGAWQASVLEGDRLLTPIHAMHIYYITEALFPVIAAGATLIHLQKYSARKFWRQCCDLEATHVQGMATIAKTMLLQPVGEWEKSHRVREFMYFLPMSDEEKKSFEGRFGIRILNLYGATETVNACIGDHPLGKRNWPSLGRVGFGYDAKIVDEAGDEVPFGETGEIWIHGIPGLTLMLGYWDNPSATEAVLTEDGWYKTGDLGYVSEDGWFYFTGRKKEMIKTKGENVSPAEVEAVLLGLDGVSEASVVGVDDDIDGCAIEAFVSMLPGGKFDENAMKDECCRRLCSFKVPRRIYLCEEFPRSSYGKISKAKLAKKAAQTKLNG